MFRRPAQTNVFLFVVTAGWFLMPIAAASGAEREAGNDWQSKWPGVRDADRNIVRYFDRRTRENVEDLRRQVSPRLLTITDPRWATGKNDRSAGCQAGIARGGSGRLDGADQSGG